MKSIDSPDAQRLVAGFMFFGAAVALVGILPIDSFGFYMFLRVVLFVGFALSFFGMLRYIDHRMEIFIVAPIGALLFNPFDIFELDKSTWVFFDIVAAALLVFWASEIQKGADKQEREDSQNEKRADELAEKLNRLKHGPGTNSEKYHKAYLLIRDTPLYGAKKQDFLDQAKEIYRVG